MPSLYPRAPRNIEPALVLLPVGPHSSCRTITKGIAYLYFIIGNKKDLDLYVFIARLELSYTKQYIML
jgi:hypothetical protein